MEGKGNLRNFYLKSDKIEYYRKLDGALIKSTVDTEMISDTSSKIFHEEINYRNPKPILDHPLRAGKMWERHYKLMVADETGTFTETKDRYYKCTGTTEITVDAGAFFCFIIKEKESIDDKGNYTLTYYSKEDEIPVKQVEYKDGSQSRVMTLTSYKYEREEQVTPVSTSHSPLSSDVCRISLVLCSVPVVLYSCAYPFLCFLSCGLNLITLPCSILLFVPPMVLAYVGDMFTSFGCSIACSSCTWWWCPPCGMGIWGIAMGCLSAGTCINTATNLATIAIVTVCPITSAPFGLMMGLTAKCIAIPEALINIPIMAIGWCCGLPLFVCCPICPTSVIFCDWGCWHTCVQFALLENICTLCSVPAIASVKCLARFVCPCCWL
jgi:hypothetical protein